MGSSGLFGKAFAKQPKGPKAPNFDPAANIALQDRTNRVNTRGPFGSQTYGTDESGRTTFTTELSPELQALVTRGMGLAGRDMQRWNMPNPANQILANVMARVNRRIGGAP